MSFQQINANWMYKGSKSSNPYDKYEGKLEKCSLQITKCNIWGSFKSYFASHIKIFIKFKFQIISQSFYF